MDGKRKCSMKAMHFADGGIVPQRPVSPYSLRGIGQGLASGYESLVGATTDLMERAMPYRAPRTPIQPAQAAEVPVAAPTPAPVDASIGGAINAIQQRRQMLNELADGGFPHIVPGRRNGNKDTVPAMLTPEEAVLPVDTVDALGGKEAVQELINRTHTPVKKQANMRAGFAGFANGTSEVEDPRFPKGAQGPSVSTRIAPVIDQTLPVPPGGNVVVPRAQPSMPMTSKAPDLPGRFIPDTRAVLSGTADDVADEWNRGNVAGAVGKVFRGAAAVPVGIASDFISPSVRGAKQVMQGGEQPGAMRRFAEAVIDRPLPSITPSVNTNLASGFAPAGPVLTDAQRGGADRTPVSMPARSNSFGNVAGDVAFDNRGPVSAQNIAAADALEARGRAERAAGLRAGMPEPAEGAGLTILNTDGVGLLSRDALAERSRRMGIDAAARGLAPKERAEFTARMEGNASQERVAAVRDATERRGQDITDGGFARRDRVTMRGQDMDYAANTQRTESAARTAAANARAEQMNKDRQFNLDVAKFGEQQAKERFDQRTAATREVSERIKSMTPAGADGKPDANAQARAMESLNAMIADRQTKLQAELQKNPGNAAAARELDAIERMGPGVFTDAQIRQLVVGNRARDVANAQGGIFDFGSSVQTTAPVTGLRRDPGLIFDDYVTNTGDRIPSWRIDGLPWQRRNADFDILKTR